MTNGPRVATPDDIADREARLTQQQRDGQMPKHRMSAVMSRHVPYQDGDNAQPAVPRPLGDEVFAGRCFDDDPRAGADRGSPARLVRPMPTLGPGGSFWWVT